MSDTAIAEAARAYYQAHLERRVHETHEGTRKTYGTEAHWLRSNHLMLAHECELLAKLYKAIEANSPPFVDRCGNPL